MHAADNESSGVLQTHSWCLEPALQLSDFATPGFSESLRFTWICTNHVITFVARAVIANHAFLPLYTVLFYFPFESTSHPYFFNTPLAPQTPPASQIWRQPHWLVDVGDNGIIVPLLCHDGVMTSPHSRPSPAPPNPGPEVMVSRCGTRSSET